MLFYLLTPLLGVLWFINLFVMLEKISKDKNIQIQKVLGVFLTFVFIVSFMFAIADIIVG